MIWKWAPLVPDLPPRPVPQRVAPRRVTINISPEEMARAIQGWGHPFFTALGMAVVTGESTHSVAEITISGYRQLLVRNLADAVTPRPLTSTVTMLPNGQLIHETVQDQ